MCLQSGTETHIISLFLCTKQPQKHVCDITLKNLLLPPTEEEVVKLTAIKMIVSQVTYDKFKNSCILLHFVFNTGKRFLILATRYLHTCTKYGNIFSWIIVLNRVGTKYHQIKYKLYMSLKLLHVTYPNINFYLNKLPITHSSANLLPIFRSHRDIFHRLKSCV